MDAVWHQVPGRPVRSLTGGARARGGTDVVVVPGLGALGYLLPLADACSPWARVHLLDLPGYGHRATARCPSRLADVAAVLVQWLEHVPDRPVLLVGHSTGAQAALRAAVACAERVSALALLGPTFAPESRRWLPLAARAARTLVHERTAEAAAVLPYYWRSRGRVLTLLRTAVRDRPEDLVPRLTRPCLVVRGRHDHLAPEQWCRSLAPTVTVPGAHNLPFTHPAEVAAELRRAVDAHA